MANGNLAHDLSAEEFLRFRDLVHSHAGIFLEESKLDSLRISLVTRATRLGADSLGDYYGMLEKDEAEFKELLNLVTINETSFFRFPQQFDALRATVLPEIMSGKRNGSRSLRMWSAGCSTGEEPYSIAMALADSGLRGLGWDAQVLGTDVSTQALAVAKAGIYGKRVVVSVPKDILSRHFEDLGGQRFRVTKAVKEHVDFGYHNLIKEPYPLSLMGNWDIIFCRNVTIYFRLESTKRVVHNFYRSLNPGGYLFIGHSETLSSISDEFEPVEIGGVFLYRKPQSKPLFTLGASAEEAAARPRKAAEGDAVAEPPELPAPAPARGKSKVKRAAKHHWAPEAESPLDEAKRLLREGKAGEALAAVGAVLEADPNNADAHLLSAYVHADTGNYQAALEACNRALALNPLLPIARYILGIIYQRQGDAIRAVSELKKTIYVDPDFALAHLNLANIYKSQRKWDSAAREYENAVRALRKSPEGDWTEFLGGFKADLLARTCERSLLECRKAMRAT